MKKYPVCKDCKYYDFDPIRIKNCFHPKNYEFDYSKGKKTRRHSACNLRTEGFFGSIFLRICGKRARWFEPREESK